MAITSSAALDTPSGFVNKIAASNDGLSVFPDTNSLGGAKMCRHRSITNLRLLSSSALEP